MASNVLTDTQISAYLAYIGITESQPLHRQRYTGHAPTDLHFLNQLHVHTLCAIPYENLSLHYNPAHTVTIDPHGTFQKTVTNARGRGGYCMENMILYSHVLRGLGFENLYLAPVRMRPRVDGVPTGEYGGWVHVVIIVTLSDESKYSIDVGFGGDCPTAPIPLVEDRPRVNLGNQDIRLIRDHLPTQRLRTEATKHWIYQYRNNKFVDTDDTRAAADGATAIRTEGAWNSFYAFSEYECMEADLNHLNWYTGSHPASFQTFTAIVVKFLRRSVNASDGDSAIPTGSPRGGSFNDNQGGYHMNQEIYGKRMLVNGIIKENLGGRTRIVRECGTERERLQGLEEWFAMTFTDEEQDGIRGWNTALPPCDAASLRAPPSDGMPTTRRESGQEPADQGAAAPIAASRGTQMVNRVTEVWHIRRGAVNQCEYGGYLND